MRKIYRRAVTQAPTRIYRTNKAITASEVRLLDEGNEHIGVVKIEEALQRATDKELDLVEIEPKANPRSARSWTTGSSNTRREKELRKQKAKQKKVEVKGVRLSLRIGEHDLDMRLSQAQRFLEHNDKVRIEMVLRGRERQRGDLARIIIQQFIEGLKSRIAGTIAVDSPVTAQGGRLNTIIGLKK